MIDTYTTFLLTLSALATSIISATVGMAGGTVLLSILLLFFTPSISIPLHAANQFVSNFRRCWLLRENIRWNFFASYAIGATIGNTFSAWLLKSTMTLEHSSLLIAIMIIYTVFKPKRLPSFTPHTRGFFFVGLFLGFLGMFIGATGLILGTCFVRDDMTKEDIMANQAVIQTYSHLLKVFGFLWLGFDYVPWLIPLAFMSVATFIGTTYGVTLVRKMSQQLFNVLFRGVLVVSAVQLLYKWSQIFVTN